ncbi:MAG: cytochrome C biogenesis protein [Deltaproteobacteria bacterium CG12_big_fil_rev_8_21_14_0_65_43_10]|nr:MAG: cytochrome C biogenesis protein [Deltaproteobacteria bacterium CG12_big_fil_rev_8_21_14_0_65_43_10]PIU85733.1 MAG: cytochrome C biogenesis protein [Deltaproteobacteria bacterium CG06_land_8_20_14_3_00_44_19]PIZ19562.1 MAG: cytochrome C biogenesis protein [Deltaproteobacteria bacterium CG_4_10_14_0_8_um_filter_43_12]PJB44508.1 MAG: cytochrome C biogenesis protein [Deltaproteobacteria bacterium CG_4_9_14_3_um_filter_44_9]HCX90669.1 cytochrome C biogenesis protein [Deltaproteobacteria bact
MEADMTQEISLLIALSAGIFTFFSPCVLPLIPSYISFITGCSVNELLDEKIQRTKAECFRNIFLETLLFVLGFGLVFTALGASATYLGTFLFNNKKTIEVVGGVIVIAFGIHLTGILKIKYLEYEKRFHLKYKPTNLFGSLVIGVAFAIGWTPCIGPILGGMLTYAAMQDTVYQGMSLLGVYSIGLGIPFIITGLCIGAFFSFFQKVAKYSRVISIASGLLLIVVGILIMTNNLNIIQSIFGA